MRIGASSCVCDRVVVGVAVAVGPEWDFGRRTRRWTSSSVVKIVPLRASSSTSDAEGAGRVPAGVKISAGKGVGQLSRKYFIVARQSGS